MPRESYVYDRELRKFVPKAEFYARQPKKARSSLPRPMIIRDFSDPVRSMADGKVYDSRRHWRDHLKAHGMVELGNDMPDKVKPEPVITDKDIAEAYQMCEQGYGAKDVKDSPPEHWEGSPIELANDES